MLGDILQYVKEITGIDPTAGSPQRAQALLYVNRAAREIYSNTDLPGSLFEREFAISTDTQMVTLPWYVSELRAARRPSWNHKIQLVTPHLRHHYKPWRQPWMQWRMLYKTPLLRHMTQAGKLTVTLTVPENEKTIRVTIKGQTPTAMLRSETLVFSPGQTSKTTTAQWVQAQPYGVVAIVKSHKTEGDVQITQEADGLLVAEIANCSLEASNRLIQIHDGQRSVTYATGEHVEVLFKWPFITLQDDTDQFVGTDAFDDAIVWKMREHWHSTRSEESDLAIAASMKCAQQISAVMNTTESAEEKFILEGENPYERAWHTGHVRGDMYNIGLGATGVSDDTTTTTTTTEETVTGITGWISLQQRTLHREHEVVMLLYHTSVDDGQGGEFEFRSDSLATNDTLDVCKPNDIASSDPGRWHRLNNVN